MVQHILCFLVATLCLSACGTPTVKLDPPVEPGQVQVEPDKTPTPEEVMVYGIAFLGYENPEDAITPPYAYLSQEQFQKMESVIYEGDEYFLILPATETGVVEVFAFDAYHDSKGELLHTAAPGAPVILRCNVSDITPNTFVRVVDGDVSATLSPVVHLRSMTAMFATGGFALELLEVHDPLKILLDDLGPDYLLGRTVERFQSSNGEEEYIDGLPCAVYTLGTERDGQRFVEEWFAVSPDGTVYELDIVMNTWYPYAPIDRVQVDNCLYMLNEFLVNEYAVEYYDTPETVKQAVFRKDMPTDCSTPDRLIGLDEEIPDGYDYDPLVRAYYPVYSISSYEGVLDNFRDYFTESCMETIAFTLMDEFEEFDGTLYLVRGGKGYGAVALDFESVDDSNLADKGIITVDTLLFGEWYQTLTVSFDWSDGIWKIHDFSQ